MKLLSLTVQGVPLFCDESFSLDFFATDRVSRDDSGSPIQDVTKVDIGGSLFSQNIVGITGVNASGKTTMLNILRMVLGFLTGRFTMREFTDYGNSIGKLGERLTFSAVFYQDGDLYLIESTLHHFFEPCGESAGGGKTMADAFEFEEETLWRYTAPRVKRSLLSDIDKFKHNAAVFLRRNGDPEDQTVLADANRTFLTPQASIVSVVTGRRPGAIRSLRRTLPTITMPTPVIRAFDPSVELLAWDAESQVYHVKFVGEEERLVSAEVATRILSRGTICGAELVDNAIRVLQDGGCLLVDEIEEALNRALVGVVLGLFSSPVTNPHGAQLIFSTHNPELLDLLSRKDSVYVLTRDADYKTHAIKLSDRLNRVERKKSEVILSNYIKGSMPRYPDVREMREYVRSCVNE